MGTINDGLLATGFGSLFSLFFLISLSLKFLRFLKMEMKMFVIIGAMASFSMMLHCAPTARDVKNADDVSSDDDLDDVDDLDDLIRKIVNERLDKVLNIRESDTVSKYHHRAGFWGTLVNGASSILCGERT